MEKLVNDKAHDLAADHEEHNYVHAGDPEKDMQKSKEHKVEILDNEEISTTREMLDDGNKGADHQSEDISLLHEKHAVNNTDAGMIHVNNENMDTHVNVALGDEDGRTIQAHAGMPSTQEKQEHNVKHAPGKLAACEKQENNVELAPLTHDPPENTSCMVSTSHNGPADTSNESHEDQSPHGNVLHDHEVLVATHDDEHEGFGQEHGRRHKTYEKATDDGGHVGVTCESGEMQMTHEKHACNAQNAEGLTHGKLTHIRTDMDSTLRAKHMHDEEAEHTPGDKSVKHGDDAGVAHELGHTQRYEVVHAEPSYKHGEKRGSEDECESKKASLDENWSKERVHFSRVSTPDVDTPTQQTSSPFSNTKSSKSGPKGAGNSERVPGSTDGIPETPSTSWAFSARASIAPSKFDHMATLRFTYGAYRETNRGKEGVPLSLLPEILESARFMVPPPRDLVPLLQRIDIDYKVGDLVRWSLLQNLALQIERKEARYPAVFIPRPSVARPNSNSPNSWKVLQRSPTRRTHPEDDCPELEPQVNNIFSHLTFILYYHRQVKGWLAYWVAKR